MLVIVEAEVMDTKLRMVTTSRATVMPQNPPATGLQLETERVRAVRVWVVQVEPMVRVNWEMVWPPETQDPPDV